MSKEKRRVPKLRFPGFTEDWEQRKFKDIAFKRGKISEADLPYVEFEDINSGIGTLNKNISQKVGHKKGLLFEAGDVLFGKLRPYLQNWLLCQFAGIAVGDFWVLQPQNVSSAFLYYLIQSEAYQSVANISSGTKMPRSSWPLVSETLFSIPKYKEANMIGEFFLLIDRTITLHQRKLNNLKLKKKALLQKLFPKNEERYPELRFPGFTDAWEQRKLSEVTTCFDNLRVPVTASDRVPGKIPYYGANGIQDYVSGHTHSGEFVLIAEDGANDLNDYPIQYVNGAIWVNNHAHVIAGYKEKLENKFLSYSLKTVKMTTFIVGGGRSKLNLKALLEIPISMPNYDEQCVIGKFIETIDINITLHQRKLDNLKLKKKALLQKLFPKNGERYPELRFPGFTDAWEQRKLGSIGSTYTGLSGKTKEDFGHGEAQYITYLNVFQNTVSDITMTDKVEIDTTQNEVKYGDVLFTTSSETPEEVGMSSVWLGHMPNIYLNSFCFGFRPNQKIDPYFLGYSLRAPYMRDKIKILAQGISRYNISKNKVMELEISLPNNEEQRLLGNFLRNIDLSITLHQRKLDHLQLQKKALLQQMFV